MCYQYFPKKIRASTTVLLVCGPRAGNLCTVSIYRRLTEQSPVDIKVTFAWLKAVNLPGATGGG